MSICFNFILSTRLGLGRYLLAIWQIFISFGKIRWRHLKAVGRQDKTWAYFFDNQQTYFRFIDDFPPKGSRDGPKFCASSISCHVSAILALFFFLGFMMSKSDWFLAWIEMLCDLPEFWLGVVKSMRCPLNNNFQLIEMMRRAKIMFIFWRMLWWHHTIKQIVVGF